MSGRDRAGTFFHGLILAAAAGIFASPIALPSGVFGAGLGALFGVWLAAALRERRYRFSAVILAALGLAAVAWLSDLVFVRSQLLPGWLGGSLALELGDLMRAVFVAGAVVVFLRGLALRFRAALAVEGTVVVLSVASTVAAHRDGMIARPLQVADWFWSQGLDPVVAFLGLGLVAALLLAGVIASGRQFGRTLAQLLLVLLLGAYLAGRLHGLDAEDRRDMFAGKSDEEKDEEAKQRAAAREKAESKTGGGSGGQGQPPPEGEGHGKDPSPNDLPRPGGSGKDRPAAVVIFHNEAKPPWGLYYFRHAVFSQWNGIRLVKTSRTDADPDGEMGFPTGGRVIEGVHQAGLGRTRVATDVALLVDHPKIFTLVDATQVAPLANPDPSRFRRAYRVVSEVYTDPFETLVGGAAGEAEWSASLWEYYTEMPKDPRYFELAAQLQTEMRPEYRDDPLAKALTVKRYLEQNATYSFKNDYSGESDPTAAFLFSEEKLGYCVHLSHAAAFLLRAMGIPARVSAGYAVSAENLGSGSALLIKQGDAHAWAEIYLRGRGWVPIEVTPEKTDVEPSEFNEQDLQQLLGEMARREGQGPEQSAPPPSLAELLRPFLDAVPYVLLALLALAYLWKTWRLLAPYLLSWRRQPKVSYRAALDWLAMGGMYRRYGESREHFARRLDLVAPSFGPITEVHVGAALGSPRLRDGRARFAELPELVSGVARELRLSQPLWRVGLGYLNPISWWWSR